MKTIDPSPNEPVNARTVTNKDGSQDIYTAEKDIFNSDSHSHYNTQTGYYRPEGEKKSKFRGYILEVLSSLSFDQLQYVEAMSTNEYVKTSAKHLINFASNIDFSETNSKHSIKY